MDVQIPGWNQFYQSEHYGRERLKTRRSIWFHSAGAETFLKIAEQCAGKANRNAGRRETLRIR